MFIIITIQDLINSNVDPSLYNFFVFSTSLEKKCILAMDSLPSEWSSRQTYTLEQIQAIVADVDSDFYAKPL